MKIKNKINKGDIDGRKYWIHPIHLTYSFEHLQVWQDMLLFLTPAILSLLLLLLDSPNHSLLTYSVHF